MTNWIRLSNRCPRTFVRLCFPMLIFYLVKMVKVKADYGKFLIIEILQLFANNIDFA